MLLSETGGPPYTITIAWILLYDSKNKLEEKCSKITKDKGQSIRNLMIGQLEFCLGGIGIFKFG